MRCAAEGEEALEQRRGFFGQHTRLNFDAVVPVGTFQQAQAGGDRAALRVGRALDQPTDARLHQRPDAHGAGLEGNVEVAVSQAVVAATLGGGA